jgi:hypothetical protein
MQLLSRANFCAIRIGHCALRANSTSQFRGRSSICELLREARRRAFR